MQVQFLNDGSDFRSRSGGGYLNKGRRSNGLFWWTILITLMLGMAVFCWFFSIMVFKYPEKPFNYRLLTKLNKLEPVKNFTPFTAPHGRFLGAKDLLSAYYYFNTEKLRYTNDALKRNYILNFTNESPVYVKGAYSVLESRKLNPNDVFSEGWVVRAKSMDMEDVQVELLLPGKTAAPPYKEGETFTLDAKSTFGTVLHVERTANDGLRATVVPIVYGKYAVGGDHHINLSPPEKMNVDSRWPVMQADGSDAGNGSDAAKVIAKTNP